MGIQGIMPPRMSAQGVTRQLASFLTLLLIRRMRFFVYPQTWRAYIGIVEEYG